MPKVLEKVHTANQKLIKSNEKLKSGLRKRKEGGSSNPEEKLALEQGKSRIRLREASEKMELSQKFQSQRININQKARGEAL